MILQILIMFGVSEGELTNEVSPSDMFEIQYDGYSTLQSKSARVCLLIS
mgnify:CR=1 FL=1